MNLIAIVFIYDGVFDGHSYKEGKGTVAMVPKDVTFNQIVDKAHMKRAIDKNKFKLRLFYFLDTPDGGKMRIEMVDEDDVGYVMSQEHKFVYVEKVERNVVEPAPNMDHRILAHVDFCDEDLHELNETGVLDAFDSIPTNFDDDGGDDDEDEGDDDFFDDDDTNLNGANGNGIGNANNNVADNENCHRLNEGDVGSNGFTGGSGINGRQLWELPGMDNFGFKEVREYALSTPYALSGLTQGSIFWSKEAMNLVVGRFALENKLSLFVLRSNKKRLEVVCTEMKKGCKFAFRARKSSVDSPLFHVTYFNPNCTCLCDPDRAERRTVTAKVIGSFFSSRVADSKFSPSTIMSEVRARWAVRLWYSKAW